MSYGTSLYDKINFFYIVANFNGLGGIRMVSENFEKNFLTFLGLGTNVVKVSSVNSELLFQWDTLAYLGHVISAKGVATDEGKIEAIKNWPTPTNITEVQSFLGFTGYYHRFIPKFM